MSAEDDRFEQASRIVDSWESRWQAPLVDPAFARLFATWAGIAASGSAESRPDGPGPRREEPQE